MKRTLHYFLLAGLVLFLASSCRKYVVTPDVPALSGRWYLLNAERYDGYQWQAISTGYESGTFFFKANGDLSYNDAIGPLHGSWNMYPVTSGYYDRHGRYQEGYHVVFSMALYESGNDNPAADWVFDDSDYNGGGTFTASYTSGNYTYSYTFARE
jgi:hypothetical protein